MTDSIKRAVRTFAQGFVGVLALIAVPWLSSIVQAVAGGGSVDIDVNVVQAIGLAAVAGGAVSLIAWAQNFLEEKTGKDLLPK